jgi:hypothetical protein
MKINRAWMLNLIIQKMRENGVAVEYVDFLVNYVNWAEEHLKQMEAEAGIEPGLVHPAEKDSK